MRVAYFDPFSGAAGDMVLGALIDAGADAGVVQRGLDALGLPGLQLNVSRVTKAGLRGTEIAIVAPPEQPLRRWREIDALIRQAPFAQESKGMALAVFARLAAAEAHVHGIEAADVHFHEVGAVDAIADVCGSCIALHDLGIEQVYSGPVRTGGGFVRAAHGLLPVPAPATAELLASANAPVAPLPPEHRDVQGELLTPTGAAILAELARFEQPTLLPEQVGYGFGRRELPWPNALRVWIGTVSDTPGVDSGGSELLL